MSKIKINKDVWPWSTKALAFCSGGWMTYSALLNYIRSKQEDFEIISCIPAGKPDSHIERWAHSESVKVLRMDAQQAQSYSKENRKVLGLSISSADYENKQIIECMKKFYAVNILVGEREHAKNIELCKKLDKNKFHWGLDNSHNGVEIFCSKRGLT